MDKKIHINFWYVIAAIFGMMFVQSLYQHTTSTTAIPYSRFQGLLNDDKVAEIGITANCDPWQPSGGSAGWAQGFRHNAGRT